MILHALAWLLRTGLGLLFLYAGGSKLVHPDGFARTIADFGIVYPGTEPTVALTMIALEILTAVALLLNLRGSLALLSGLLLLFVAVLTYGTWLGLDLECGCLGAGTPLRMRTTLLMDIGLLGCCVYLYWWRWFSARGAVRPVAARRRVSRMQGMEQ
jgi:uncharacterized membrane protein